MLRSLLLPVLALFLSAILPLRAHAEAQGVDVLAVVKVPGLQADAAAKLAALVGREKGVGIEYTCLWAGVLVFHLEDASLAERADVITYLRRLLGQAGISGAEFLDVHLAPRGPGKC
ncbi:MAG TPA: hypothetical protein PKE21_11720 [Flavobacteriales bacterium]|nr:hypothetical protein [Flavobacteriales bacterium]HMR28139.1 hypothetical protein [Flavobacteriales bacterium]